MIFIPLAQERKVIIISTVRCNQEFVSFDLRHKLGKDIIRLLYPSPCHHVGTNDQLDLLEPMHA